MTYVPPPLGCSRQQLDTPSLILDLDVFERNVTRLAEFFRQNRVAWRPHAKSYKCTEVVKRVVAAGAIGVTCAKLGEAEVFADAGVRDLLITGPLVGPRKLERLVALRRRADPITVVDHVDHVAALAAAAEAGGVRLRVLIEIDMGMSRCGVAPGAPAVELARTIAASPSLELAGIMGWEGHLLMIDDAAEKHAKIASAIGLLADTRRQLEAAGLPCPIVSAGGTGSFQVTATLGVATEIQAGGAVFMDLFYANKCHVTGLEFALTLLGSVISRPAVDRAVVDAGRKSFSPDLHLPAVAGRDDAKVKWLSAEHGVLDVVAAPGPRIGEKIEFVLGYGDWTTVLHDRYYVFRGDRLEAIWPLDARGRAD
ncbi:MAG TPA: DSD1 family PLP-dependent enzyme [Pirellulaceae bacterium]|nr:DSD1 family PLP-dependent enzyme [Pirellulaceae bacterium]